MKSKKNLLLTFDYELYLGIKSGTVENCIIKPANKILNILNRVNAKAIFFVDTISLSRLEKIAGEYPKAKEDFNKIINQLKEILKHGHDVFYHFHPHWNYAEFIPDENEWTAQYNAKFVMGNLNEDEKNKVFEDSFNILQKYLILPLNIDYKINGYRAGGLYIQPFMAVKQQFEKYQIKYEFSVLRGFESIQKDFNYDFSDIPLKKIYPFDEIVSVENLNGKFIEFTIDYIQVDTISKISNSLWIRFLERFFDAKRMGDGIATKAYLVNKGISKNLFHNKETLSIELLNITKIAMYLNYLANNEYMHFISHTKFFSEHNLWAFEKFINKADKKYELITDFRKMI